MRFCHIPALVLAVTVATADLPTFTPYPGAQEEFAASTIREVFFGGSAGPGKSLCLLMDPMRQVLVEDGRWRRGEIRRSAGAALHLRRTYPELEESIVRSHDYFPAIDAGATYDKQSHVWTFSSGYRFKFAGIEGEQDRFKFRSNQYTHIGWDELTSFTWTQYSYVNTRLRSADPVLAQMLVIRATGQPDGEGILWVRDRFIDPAPEGRKVIRTWVRRKDGTLVPRDRMFLPADLSDNKTPGFREQYEAELADKPAHIRESLLYGNWYTVADAFFAEDLIPDVHFVDAFDIPDGYFRFRSGDYGYREPSCILWWAVDFDGNLICYRELYVRKHDAEELAFRIREIEESAGEWSPDGSRGSRMRGPLDTSCWARVGTVGPTVAETMFAAGVWWDKCTKDRLAATRELRRRLKARSGPPPKPGEKDNRVPGIRWFKNCRNTIRTLPTLVPDETNGEVPKEGGEDHCLHGDTMVVTDRGEIAIRELVETEGRVLSIDGRFEDYRSCRLTRRDQPLVRVTFEDGRSVVSTPDHRFLTSSGEWIEALALTDATVYAYNPCESESLVQSSRNSRAFGTTSAGSTFNERGGGFTSRYGARIEETCRRGIKSIIATTIGQTTRSKISSAFRRQNTAAITGGRMLRQASRSETSSTPRKGLARGTEAPRDAHGTENTPSGYGGIVPAWNASAMSAAMAFPRSSEMLGAVVQRVLRRLAGILGLTTRNGFAEFAESDSQPIATASSAPVPEHAVRCLGVEPAGRGDVYCLTVPATRAFAVASGIVVSNCFDSVSYACMARPLTPERDARKRKMREDELEERREQMRQARRGGRGGYGGL